MNAGVSTYYRGVGVGLTMLEVLIWDPSIYELYGTARTVPELMIFDFDYTPSKILSIDATSTDGCIFSSSWIGCSAPWHMGFILLKPSLELTILYVIIYTSGLVRLCLTFTFLLFLLEFNGGKSAFIDYLLFDNYYYDELLVK